MNSFRGPEDNQQDPGMVAASPDGPTRLSEMGPTPDGYRKNAGEVYARPGSVWVAKPALPEFGETVTWVGEMISGLQTWSLGLWKVTTDASGADPKPTGFRNTAGETDNRLCFSRINESGAPESG